MIPVGRISSISKSGTTTATVITDTAHGLTTTSFVYIYGVRDTTNFPNLTTSTQVASIVNTTTFTIVIGTASTTSSNGGGVFLVNGGVANTQFIPQVIQSVASTVSGILSVVGSATWTTPLPGEYMHLYGLTLAQSYEGAYKVLRVNGTTLELQTTVPTFTLINTGGTALSGGSVTISSIPGTYKHLLIIIDRVTSSGSVSYNNISITPNSLTTATTLTYGQYSYSGESLQSIIPISPHRQ
jgi:hypothetical protein